MKRRILALLLAVLTLTALTTAAFAAEPDPTGKGVYNIRTTNGYKLTVDGVEATKGFYAKGDKFELSCTNLSGQYSIVFLINTTTGDTTKIYPTDSNLYYIDQKSVEETTTFNLLPKKTADSMDDGTYHVYVSTSGESGQDLEKVASFEYGEYPGYMLGDVDNDGNFTAADALAALNISVGLGTWSDEQKLAAHVLGDPSVSAADALTILRRSVGLISSF